MQFFFTFYRSLDFDDFSGNFCHQGKYPLLSVLNHYLRPELNIALPRASILWVGKHNSSSKSKTISKRPTHETDLLLNSADSIKANSLSSHNIFGLIQNEGKLSFIYHYKILLLFFISIIRRSFASVQVLSMQKWNTCYKFKFK